jgi:hypothetical protein
VRNRAYGRAMRPSTIIRLLALGASCVGVLAAPAGASSAAGDHWYRSKGSSCIARPGLSGAFARASVLMHSDDFASTNVQAFKISARLVPTTAGINISRPWTNYTQKVSLTGAHTLLLTVFAPVPDVAKDWSLQIHVTWDRMTRLDWHTSLTVKQFNTAKCPGASDNGFGPAPPSTVSAGGS